MEKLHALKAFFHNFFLAPSIGRRLAGLRIVVGLAMVAEALVVFPYLDELYGQYGYLQAHLLDAVTSVSVPGFFMHLGVSPVDYTFYLRTFYLVHIATSLLFALGWKTRWTSVGVWITQSLIINSGAYSSYGVDRYFHNFTFFMMLFPVGNVWSLDSYLAREKARPSARATLGTRLIQIFLLTTYINAGVAKSLGHDWWSGAALWESVHLPEFHQVNMLWMANYPLIPKLWGLQTLFCETFYFIGVWIPFLGPLWVLVMAGMHLGIAAFMGMKIFGITLAMINLVVLFGIPAELKRLREAYPWRPAKE